LIAEERLLSFSEWEEMIELEKMLDKMISIEELWWKQRVGVTAAGFASKEVWRRSRNARAS